MNNDIIGKNIRKFRELKGYSQEYREYSKAELKYSLQ